MADQTLERIKLSGSTNGRAILVAATASLGTLIHTAHATADDYVTLYVTNNDTSAILLTLEFGGTTDPNDLIRQTIEARTGLTLVVPSLPLTGGVLVRAFAGTTNKLSISGFVERCTTQ